MSGSYIASSLASLSESTSLFASIKFDRQCPLSEAVLSSERQFEQSFIRDAEPHELALFETPVESLPNDEDTAMKRVGPQPVAALNKDRASPLKDRKAADDPQRCLVAARKLLDVYPVPKASDHVNALLEQLRGLIQSLQASEDALKQPAPKSNEADETAVRTAELQDAIKREQMEIFAIEQMNEERRKAVASQKTMRPTTTNGKTAPVKKSMKDAIAEKRAAAKAAASKPSAAHAAGASSAVPSPARAPIRSPNRATPVASPIKAATNTPAVKITSPGSHSPDKTPTKASPARAIASQTTPVKITTPVKAKTTPKKARDGIPDEELAKITAKLWSTIGDSLKPWARKSSKQTSQTPPSPLDSLPFEQTKAAMRTALVAKPTEPASPGSLASTALTNEEEDDPAPPAAQQLVEFELLRLLLDVMSGASPESSSGSASKTTTTSSPSHAAGPAALTITYRDALSSATKEPMVSMAALKACLLKFAKERECSDDLATKAIYSLVSKNVLRIDRRGTAAVGFRA